MAIIGHLYRRFSDPSQAKGRSYARQAADTAAFAERHGIALDPSRDIKEPGAVSAFRSRNFTSGELGKWLAKVDSGEIPAGHALVFENMDRFSRDTLLASVPVFLKLLQQGIIVGVVDIKELLTKETSSETVHMVIGKMLAAHAYSKRLKTLLDDVWVDRRKEAIENKKPMTGICPLWLELQNGKYEPIPERVEVVQRIFELALKKSWPQNKIAKWLNDTRMPTFNGRDSWNPAYVRQILRNPAVLGEYQPCRVKHVEGLRRPKSVPDGNAIAGYFPRIIEQGVFDQVNSTKRHRVTHHKEGTKLHFLKGLAVCSACGSPMWIRQGTDEKDTYLRCSAAKDGKRNPDGSLICTTPRTLVRYDIVWSALLACLTHRDIDLPGLLSSDKGAKKAELQAKLQNLDGRVATTQAELKRLAKSLRRLEDEAAEAVEDDMKDLGRELKLLKAERAAVQDDYRRASNGGDSVKGLQEQMKAYAAKKDDEGFRYELNTKLGEVIETVAVQYDPEHVQRFAGMILQADTPEDYAVWIKVTFKDAPDREMRICAARQEQKFVGAVVVPDRMIKGKRRSMLPKWTDLPKDKALYQVIGS